MRADDGGCYSCWTSSMSRETSGVDGEISKKGIEKKGKKRTRRPVQPLQYEIIARSSPRDGLAVIAILFCLAVDRAVERLAGGPERRESSYASAQLARRRSLGARLSS